MSSRPDSSRVARLALVGAPALAFALVAFGACNDDPVHFGPPGGLTGRQPDDIVPPTPDSGGSSGEGGSSSGGTCTPPAADAGAACAASSFATSIYTPMMAAGGTYKCAGTGCHAAGGTAPPMPDATTAYTNLKAYTITIAGKKVPYINTGCIEPAQASFECNLQVAFCGAGHMPTTGQVSAADLATITTWIGCGSPP